MHFVFEILSPLVTLACNFFLHRKSIKYRVSWNKVEFVCCLLVSSPVANYKEEEAI